MTAVANGDYETAIQKSKRYYYKPGDPKPYEMEDRNIKTKNFINATCNEWVSIN